MLSYDDCYNSQCRSSERFRVTIATNIAPLGDNLLAIVIRHCPSEHDNHDTLITVFHKGNDTAFLQSAEKALQVGERVEGIARVAELNGQPVHALQLHTYTAGPNSSRLICNRTKTMIDQFSNDGLISQTTAQELYTRLKLNPEHKRPEQIPYRREASRWD